MSTETPANKRTALMAAVRHNASAARMMDALQDRMVEMGASEEELTGLVETMRTQLKPVTVLAEEFMDWLEPGWR